MSPALKSEKLIVLRAERDSDKKRRASAFVADITWDPNTLVTSLTFKGPTKLEPRDSDDIPYPAGNGNPIYSDSDQTIYWPVSVYSSNDDANANKVWHLNKYLAPDAMDYCEVGDMHYEPSLMVYKGTVAMAYQKAPSGMFAFLNPGNYMKRALETYHWDTLDTQNNKSATTNPLLVQPPLNNTGLTYGYHLRINKFEEKKVHISCFKMDTIESTPDHEPFSWQTFELEGVDIKKVDHAYELQIQAVVLGEAKTGFKLYIFTMTRCGIAYSFLPLRSDGSINESQGKVEVGTEWREIPGWSNPSSLMVLSHNMTVMLLWSEHDDGRQIIRGLSGKVSPGGIAPKVDEWKKVETNFFNDKLGKEEDFSFSAVSVPSTYI